MHVKDWLLEAELADVSTPPAEIAAHLQECDECREVQRMIVGGYAQLDVGLTKLTRRRRKKTPWVLVPLAAAAAMTLMIGRGEEKLPPRNTVLAQLMFPEQAVVVPQEGQQAVVIDKNEMTVVWFTSNKGQQ